MSSSTLANDVIQNKKTRQEPITLQTTDESKRGVTEQRNKKDGAHHDASVC